LKKHFKKRFLKIYPTTAKQHQKINFQSAAKGAAATARYYFYSVTGAVAPLSNLTKSGNGVYNKVGPPQGVTRLDGWRPHIRN